MLYKVKISWQRNPEETFVDNRYNRAHNWIFDCGIEVPASSSPHVVPLPMSKELAVDPEEAFIASISSCHTLWFLSIAAAKKFIAESYEDKAEGILAKDDVGKLMMTKVTLKPKIVFIGDNIPSIAQVDELHHQAHEKCFISNSVKTAIKIMKIQ